MQEVAVLKESTGSVGTWKQEPDYISCALKLKNLYLQTYTNHSSNATQHYVHPTVFSHLTQSHIYDPNMVRISPIAIKV